MNPTPDESLDILRQLERPLFAGEDVNTIVKSEALQALYDIRIIATTISNTAEACKAIILIAEQFSCVDDCDDAEEEGDD